MLSRLAPAVTVAATGVILLAITGVAPWLTLWYAVVFCWTTLGPGLLISRSLRPPAPNRVSDLAFGAAFGLAANLAAWLGLTLIGAQYFLLAWPLAIYTVFAIVPKLRQFWKNPSATEPPTTGTSWLLATAILWQLAIQGVTFFVNTAVPPSRPHWYPDNYYHLSIAAELLRQVPPTTPQVAGRPLIYYWLPHADVAAAHLSSGIDLAVIYGRLWYPTIMVIVLTLTYAVARRHGGLVALLLSFGFAWQPFSFGFSAVNALALDSPTLLFSLPFVLLAIDSIWTALANAGRPPRLANLIQFAIAAIGLTGTKVSGIPVIICGLLLAGFVALFRNRRLIWPILSRLALSVGAIYLTAAWFLDAGAGSEIRFLNQFSYQSPWSQLPVAANETRWLVENALTWAGFPLLLAMSAIVVATYGFLLLNRRSSPATELDSGAAATITAFLAGVGVSGLFAYLSIVHTGGSQAYFMMCAAPAVFLLFGWRIGEIATAKVWLGVALGPSIIASVRLVEWLVGTGSIAGLYFGLATLVFLVTGMLRITRRRHSLRVGLALGAILPSGFTPWYLGDLEIWLILGLSASGLLVAAILWWRPNLWRLLAILGVSGLVVTVLVGTIYRLDRDHIREDSLTDDEVAAVLWLKKNTVATDLVATNVHCTPQPSAPHCSATAFWLSGLSGRRVFIEGWAYTDAAHARNGYGGYPANRQLFDDNTLFALNEDAFYAPTPSSLNRLRTTGVRWLFADTAAGTVSPVLSGLATKSGLVKPAFTTDTVVIYDLGEPPN